MKGATMRALGEIETVGLTAAIVAADTAVKAANVDLVGYELTNGGGMVVVRLEGDVGAIKAAVDAATVAASATGKVVSCHVIPRPSEQIAPLIRGEETVGVSKNGSAPAPAPAATPAPVATASTDPGAAPSSLDPAPLPESSSPAQPDQATQSNPNSSTSTPASPVGAPPVKPAKRKPKSSPTTTPRTKCGTKQAPSDGDSTRTGNIPPVSLDGDSAQRASLGEHESPSPRREEDSGDPPTTSSSTPPEPASQRREGKHSETPSRSRRGSARKSPPPTEGKEQ